MADIDALTDPAISDRDALGEFLESLTDKVPTIERERTTMPRTTPWFATMRYPGNSSAVVTMLSFTE